VSPRKKRINRTWKHNMQ